MSFTLGLIDFAIKKGLKKDKIFIIYSIFYFVLCVLLVFVMRFSIVGILAVLVVYLIRIFFLREFLNRHIS
ncbi:MAG: hypothetical protein AMXMBFR79_07350 [Chitinophagaceae bacterium]